MSDTKLVPRYVVITPVRDEEANLPQTLQSMMGQTVRPTEWVIVNDGSTDKTAQILDEAAARNPWIHPVHRANRGFRKSGGGVMEAFFDGYRALGFREFDYLVKLDGDLVFEPDYFEQCFKKFEEEPRLGVGGGVIYNRMPDGSEKFELGGPAFHVRGATKIYRRACWDDMGGLWPATGWDTLDEVKANMKGWSTRNFPDVRLVQLRVTGGADGRWGDLVKNGRANYISGYHPVFMLVKCVSRLRRRPCIIGSLALFCGFASGYFKRLPRVDDPELVRYLRRQQMSRLFGGSTIWR